MGGGAAEKQRQTEAQTHFKTLSPCVKTHTHTHAASLNVEVSRDMACFVFVGLNTLSFSFILSLTHYCKTKVLIDWGALKKMI